MRQGKQVAGGRKATTASRTGAGKNTKATAPSAKTTGTNKLKGKK